MRRILFFLLILWESAPFGALGQENAPASPIQFTAKLQPAELGFRFDDNVYRSVSVAGKFADEIYLLNLGGELGAHWGVFSGNLGYQFGADQYQRYPTLSNLKNDFRLFLSADPGGFSFYYKKDYYIRNSQYFEFSYAEDENLLGFLWTPPGQWNYEISYKNYSRQYDDDSDEVKSRNYIDQGVLASAQREIDDKFSLKLEGSYNNRQFQRVAVGESGGAFVDLGSMIQTDETWTLLLNAHLYFESILQDIDLEEQRTNSNSYGFSNNVQSVSWAGVVRPASSLYLQLFFRLYFKTYDVPPLVSPDLQLGFVDEDSQDLLSIRGTWEWAPQWTASLGLSRARSESDQPGMYYIKNLFSAQIRKNF